MRLASVLVSSAALLIACGDSSFTDGSGDAGSDGSSIDASTDASIDGGLDASPHASVAVRDFSAAQGDLAVDAGDDEIALKIPGSAQASDVVIAVIGLYPVGGDDTSTMSAPSDWQPSGSFFNDIHGGNLSFQWHVFAFATQVTSVGQTANFVLKGFTGSLNGARWYAALVAYSGAPLAPVEFKGINDSPNQFPYVSFPSVIVGADGSHVFSGVLTQNPLPSPLLALPPNVSEIGSGFLTGLGRFTDQPVPTAMTLPAYTIPTGPNDAGPDYWSTTFQFLIAPAR